MLTWPGLLLCRSTVNFLPSYAFSQPSRSPVPATVLKYLPVHDCVFLNGPFPFLGVSVLTDRTLSFTCQDPHCQLSAPSLVVPLKLVLWDYTLDGGYLWTPDLLFLWVLGKIVWSSYFMSNTSPKPSQVLCLCLWVLHSQGLLPSSEFKSLINSCRPTWETQFLP